VLHGFVYTSFVRRLGGLLAQFIDDHTLAGWGREHGAAAVRRCVYALLVAKGVHGGYSFSLKKSDFEPAVVFRTLGLQLDIARQAFLVPADKVVVFVSLGEELLVQLETGRVDFGVAARFAGQAMSFWHAKPYVRVWLNSLYLLLTGRALHSDLPSFDCHQEAWWHPSRIAGRVGERDPVRARLVAPLRVDILALTAMVQVEEVCAWVEPRHLHVAEFSSDATLSHAGMSIVFPRIEDEDREVAALFRGQPELLFGGSLPAEMFTVYGTAEIAGANMGTTEYAALACNMLALDRQPVLRRMVQGCRLVFKLDNFEVVCSLRGSRVTGLYSLEKLVCLLVVFSLLRDWNAVGLWEWVASEDNRADAPSRDDLMLRQSLRLAPTTFAMVLHRFGAVDFDVCGSYASQQHLEDGSPLPYYSRSLDAMTSGVDVFACDCVSVGRVYAYPPFSILAAVVEYLQRCGAYGVLICPAFPEPLPGYLRATAWAQRLLLPEGSCELRRRRWEVFRAAPPLVAVPFDFR
jgi:hypothetical protein